MRIAVVVSPGNRESRKLMEEASAAVSALEKRGYQAEIINTEVDADKKLTIFDYLIFISETLSFFSTKNPSSLTKYLASCGTISGKRAAVILGGKSLFKTKAMALLMKSVENEGVILKTSEFCPNAQLTSAFVSKLNVERNY